MMSSRPKSDENISDPVEVSGDRKSCREDPTYPPGALVGSYWVEDVIGAGGTACVYRATHAKIGRRVALKSLQGEYAADPEVVERFFAEARAANKVDHDNIVQVTDLVEDQNSGTFYFVMELLEGFDLEELIELEGALPVERAMRIAVQVADGLAAAHEVGIVHRDLKPGNVYLVESERRDDFVKILDFGVAKVAADIEQLNVELGRSNFRTKPGALIGTPAYMSPEQLSGSEVSHLTDVYSFGLLLYELLTGTPPFGGESFADIVVAHKTETPEPPRSRMESPEEVPAELEALVLHCLEKEPSDRPQSMAGILQVLVALASREGYRLEVHRPATPTPTPVPGERASRPDTLRLYREDLVEATKPSKEDVTLEGLDRALIEASMRDDEADDTAGRPSEVYAATAVEEALEAVMAETALELPDEADDVESLEIALDSDVAEGDGETSHPAEVNERGKGAQAPEKRLETEGPTVAEHVDEDLAEGDAEDSRPSRGAMIAVIVGACCVLGAVAYILLRPGGPPPPTEEERAPAAPATVALTFDSTPEGAEVYQEGGNRPIGTTPFEKSFHRGEERVTFEFRKAGFEVVRRAVQLSSDGQVAAALAALPTEAPAEPRADAAPAEAPTPAAKAPSKRPRRPTGPRGDAPRRPTEPTKRPRDLGALVDPYAD